MILSMTSETSAVTILVPGELHEQAVKRMDEAFRVFRIERADPGFVTDDLARNTLGVAAMTTVDAAFIDALPRLQIIASFGVGYDHVDARHAAGKGVMVTNTPDVLTEEVADTAIGLLLNTVRELPKAEAWLREGRWIRDGAYPLT